MRLQLNLSPMPCPRPRIAGKPFPHAYYPAAYKAWKKEAVKAICRHLPRNYTPYTHPVAVKIWCYVERPKTTKLDAPKPDVDNYAKSILDALTDADVWTDDTVVVSLTVLKRWADVSCIEIAIETEYLP